MEQDLYYLRSILRSLREVREFLYTEGMPGPSLGREILADNIDWLDCYIDAMVKTKGKVHA